MTKLIVTGSESYNNYEHFERVIDKMISSIEGGVEIISGRSTGVDNLSKVYTLRRGLDINDNFYQGESTVAQSMKMCDYGDRLVVFSDGKSLRTEQMINYMKKLGKVVTVISVK